MFATPLRPLHQEEMLLSSPSCLVRFRTQTVSGRITRLTVQASRARGRAAKKQQALEKSKRKALKNGGKGESREKLQEVIRTSSNPPSRDLSEAISGAGLREGDLAAGEEGDSTSATRGKRSPRGRGAKAQATMKSALEYRDAFAAAIEHELSEEMDRVRSRVHQWPLARLQQEGYVATGLNLQPEGFLYKEQIMCFYLSDKRQRLPSQVRFGTGDAVAMSVGGTPVVEGEDARMGLVLERSPRFVRVCVSQQTAASLLDAGAAANTWRLDYAVNTVAYERMMTALETVVDPKLATLSMSQTDHRAEPKAGFVLRPYLLSPMTRPASFREECAMRPPWSSGAEGGKWRESVKQVMGKIQVNPSQKAAMLAALNQRITLWQGPPGTGKTRTTVLFVKCFLAVRGNVQALVTADSNVAADNLTEGLIAARVRVVRVGSPASVRADLREFTLHAQASKHPLGQEAARIRNEVQDFQADMRTSEDQQMGRRNAAEAWAKAEKLQKQAEEAVLRSAHAVTTTCIGAGNPVLDGLEYSLCVVDEACQATEPSTLVPLVKGVETLLLVGDPKQLPATVVSQEAVRAGLQVSLFERLQLAGAQPKMLETQYRMHPHICKFPSEQFYNGRLQSHFGPSHRMPPAGFDWPNPMKPLAFIDVPQGREASTSENSSFCNKLEAQVVAEIVRSFQEVNSLKDAEIGIITPYRGQVNMLKTVFAEEGLITSFPDPDGLGDTDLGSPQPFPSGEQSEPALEIKTVDGFQGREKEVIVFSAVRANENRSMGFLKDYRRLNVAITRAKRGLIVVGNADTLSTDPIWADWLEHAFQEQLCISALDDNLDLAEVSSS